MIHVAYRFFDSDGALLYVGITSDLEGRLAAHRKSSGWFRYAVRMEVVAYPTREAAEEAEREAIATEAPLCNQRAGVVSLQPKTSETSRYVIRQIKTLLAERQMRSADLADVLNLNRSGVSRRMTGVIPFDVGELHAVAVHLGVPMAALLPAA